MLVQHRHSVVALAEAAGEEVLQRCSCPPTGYNPGEFPAWLLGMVPAAKTPGEPKPPSHGSVPPPCTERCTVVKQFNLLFIQSAVLKV